MNSTDNRQDQCVIVFVKVPQKTSVKTRLAESIGKAAATDLYKHFVADILETLNKSRHNCIICFYPPHARSEASGWLGHTHILLPQHGNNLGARMSNAFVDAFSKGFRHVLLIGTDFPDLPAKVFDNAFTFLPENDVVIGPAADGGYYLIGFNADTFQTVVFDEMPWGTKNVFDETIKRLRDKKRRVYILPKWRDIDTVEDLDFFRRTHSGNPSAALNTVAYLKHIGFNLTQTDRCKL